MCTKCLLYNFHYISYIHTHTYRAYAYACVCVWGERYVCKQASVRVCVCVVFVYILFVVLFAQFATFSSHSSTKCALGFNIAFCRLLYFSYCLFFIDFKMLLHFVDTLTIAHTHTNSDTCMPSHTQTHTNTHTRWYVLYVCILKEVQFVISTPPTPLTLVFVFSPCRSSILLLYYIVDREWQHWKQHPHEDNVALWPAPWLAGQWQ